MDSASNLEKLHSKLTCPICLELFKEPVHVACGDHFCMPCISQLWEKCEESFSCPQCGKTFEDRSLETSPLLGNVVESVREMRLRSKHDSQCEEHEEKLKLFCEDDQRAICVVCGCSREHKTHNVIPIKEAFQSYKVCGEAYCTCRDTNPFNLFRTVIQKLCTLQENKLTHLMRNPHTAHLLFVFRMSES